jgi:hypothetical protein
MRRLTILALIVLSAPLPRSLAEDLAKDLAKAEGGDFDAMLAVGQAYLSGKDEAKQTDGIKWLEMSSAGGNLAAYYHLGAAYQDGTAVTQDPQKAVMYLTLAAEFGDIRAMSRLAAIYYTGRLVPTNDVFAIKWGLCAAARGDEAAKIAVEAMKSHVDKRSVAFGAMAAEAWAKKRFPISTK